MHPLETYLITLRTFRLSASASDEISYYPALVELLNVVGGGLDPAVICVPNLKNIGAGHPDAGLFTSEQLTDLTPEEGESILDHRKPARGVVEVKSTGEEVADIAKSAQVRRYWARYNQVLVTNYRAFALVVRDRNGKLIATESYELASSAEEFWAATKSPKTVVQEHGDALTEYLRRVISHAAPITDPEDLASLLAAYAREALARVEGTQLTHLKRLRDSLELALGLRFEGEKGEHFFRSTLVQTLFYGVFSAWVLWCSETEDDDSTSHFDWRLAQWQLHVPMIRAVFEEMAKPSQIGPLDIVETLDWAEAALERVDRVAFFDQFEDEDAVQYFYEPFLAAFDPQLRKDLGVWYTPRQVVRYMVKRVDQVLRQELRIEKGLADENVYILDPATGTGAYLVEVLRHIAESLGGDGDALVADDVRRIATERVFGFEILPSPFIVAHLQVGLLLRRLGAPLQGDQRAPVFLTNSLTGWDGEDSPRQLPIPEFEEERTASERVKREAPILVVLGNPPYNAFAGTSPDEERNLVDPYKAGLNTTWGIKKYNLDDLYVRFFRLAERRIVDMTGRGVVCYISNFSYLGDASFVVMREHLLDGFDKIWIDSLNGDSRETGKRAPDGTPDPSIFSTPRDPVGIQKGTAIGLFARTGEEKPTSLPPVFYRNLWGTQKREELLESLEVPDFNSLYETAGPAKENRFSFKPLRVSAEYLSWPRVVDLCAEAPSNGLMEKRGGALIDIDRAALEQRMQAYYDKNLSWDAARNLIGGLAKDAARYDAENTRHKVLQTEGFAETRLRPYAVRPLDHQWAYYSPVRPLWNEPRPVLWARAWEGNEFILSRFNRSKSPEGAPFYYTVHLSDDHLLAPDAVAIPVWLGAQDTGGLNQQSLLDASDAIDRVANLSPRAREYLASIGIADPDSDLDGARSVWHHSLAIGYSPAYLHENEDGVAHDWPRIPLPASSKLLQASAALGRELSRLLVVERDVPGITTNPAGLFQTAGVISSASGEALDPAAGDLRLTAEWGRKDKRGAVMPGPGSTIQREYSQAELDAMAETAVGIGMTMEDLLGLLGEATCDIYLNDKALWRNVPDRVWEYTIGGYQVIKKWLSYRDEQVIGRSLRSPEVREVSRMVRRIAGILLLEPRLNANYTATAATVWQWD